MKKLIQSIVLSLVLFIPGHVWALNKAGDLSDNSLNQLLQLSGLNKQVEGMSAMVQAGFDQARNSRKKSNISDAEAADIEGIIKDSFRSSKILGVIGDNIRDHISESEAKKLLVWYRSDIGKKITKAEVDASTPAAYQDMIQQARELLAKQKRVEIAREIDDLLNVTDMTVERQENMMVAIYAAMSSAINPEKHIDTNALKAQLSVREQQMRANVEQLTIVSFVYAYRDIKIDDLEKYVRFLKRSNTMKFNNSVMTGMNDALERSIEHMAKSLATVLVKYKKKQFSTRTKDH